MKDILKFSAIGLIVVILGVFIASKILGDEPQLLGGITNYDALDVTDGYYVDASQVIDGSGQFIGVIDSATSTTGYLTNGGKYTSISTTSATYTLSASEFESSVVDIESTATGAALTLTLPATTTGAYGPTAGDRVYLTIKNSHTAAATTTTVAAGTGVDLQEPDGQNVVIGINNYAWIICLTLDTTDVACEVDESIPAD